MIPQLDYCTNDIWELAAAYGTDNSFPIVLRVSYGAGKLSIITIPDNMGDLYHYPQQVMKVLRELFSKEMPVVLDAPAGIQLFVYDNDKIILRSDLNYYENVTLCLADRFTKVIDMVRGVESPVSDHRAVMQLTPGINYVLALE